MASAAVSPPFNEERWNPYLEPRSCKDAVEESPDNTPTGSFGTLNNVDEEEEKEYQKQEEYADSLLGASRHPAPPLEIIDSHAAGTTLSESENSEKDSSGAGVMLVNGDAEKVTSTGEGSREIGNSGIPWTECREPGLELFAIDVGESRSSLDCTHEGSPRIINGVKPSSEEVKSTTSPVATKPQDLPSGENTPPVDYKEGLQQDHKETSREDSDRTLVSGRQAGKRWYRSRVRFAPWNVPLKRRLQTLVVLFHSTCIALSVSAFFFLCAIPIFWPLLIPYMIYCMSSNAAASGTLTHRSNILRGSPIWSLFASYFPARLHRTHELPPTRKYIFGYHPHGIISHGAWAAFATEALGFSQLFPGITNTLLTLDSNFRVPIYRSYVLAMGLASVSRESCENLLSKGGTNGEGMGRAITIVIGGAAESLDAQPYSLRLVLKRRKGFVKMALRTGADLVPVLAFGENDLYDQFSPDSHPNIHKAQLLLKKLLGFTIPLFHARGVFNYDVGLMPYRRSLNIVVGRPIKVAQSAKPSQEEVDKLHAEYIEELQILWDTWKDDFAKDRKGELEVCE